ncbi:hypothetical protein JFU49_17970 [Pseudomonas sp. TH03]|uniref:hypothetical protein n=1 Tax=Pseudomonas sp. TH03 TaxID=2796369 RepID=UPI0019144B79|nr:hypothetical protein [Pseudomonas sp. TH03]MBK5552146.1 hypothetical protein [Pseudomonas sp. TH03]
MKIKKVEIQAFRAYREKENGTFDFTIKDDEGVSVVANFVSIYAPNGFGKSSFYDAVEWAFTDRLDRYEDAIYESAARETKTKEEALKVLRNHDSPPGLATSVKVYTTNEEIFNELGTPRKTSIDLNLKKKKLEDGTEKYREIFLSQDAIDHFIRGVSPEIRYKEFMAFFGGKTEVLRHELQSLYLETSSILKDIQEEEVELNTEIAKPLDGAIVDSFYETATHIKNSDVELESISESFFEMDMGALAEELARNKVRVRNALSDLDQEIEVVNLLSDKSNDYLSSLSELTGAIEYQSSINKSLADCRTLNAFDIEFKEGVRQKDDCLRNMSRHNKVSECLVDFRAFLLERDIASKAVQNYEEKLAGVITEIESNTSLSGFFSETILKLRENMLTWEALSNGAVNVYSRVNTLRSELKILHDSEPIKKAQLKAAQNEILISENHISKVNNIALNVESITSEELSLIDVDPVMLSSFREISKEFVAVQGRIDHLKSVLKGLESQHNLFEKLTSLGREVLALHPTDNCPLCQQKFASFDELNKAIDENSNIRKIVQDTVAQVDRQNKLLEELNNQRKENMLFLAQRKEAKLKSIEKVLAEKLSEVSGFQDLLSRDVARVNAINSELINQQAVVLNLSEGDLRLRVNQELKDFADKISKTQSTLNGFNSKLESLSELSGQLQAEINELKLKISSIEANPVYRQVTEYMEEHRQPVENHTAFFLSLASQYEIGVAKIDEKLKALSEKILDVNERLKNSGLSANQEALINELVQVESKIMEVREKLSAFTRQYTSIVGEALSDDTDVSEMLAIALESADSRRDEKKSVLASLELLDSLSELLVPFISKEAAKNKLAQLSVKKTEHALLCERLVAEINQVNEVLGKQLDFVFYTDLINAIYRKIDPHPSFKEIKFAFGFGVKDKPCLNVFVSENSGDGDRERVISPLLHFSSAQLNILSLSIFLARALHAKDKDGQPLDVILIDDPIHSMDSINILSTIDLLRGLAVNHDKQIIISTHDENFYELLKRKLPTEYCPSKFLRLKTFGEVSTDS